jgi:nitrous oxide reductase
MLVVGTKEKGEEVLNKKVQKHTFRRQPRAKGATSNAKQAEGSDSVTGRKRSGDEVMEIDVSGQQGKEVEVSNKKLKLAGLADQPCRNQ